MHVGDFAYDLADNGGQTAATFMRQIEPVASRVPYMGCPGNHEGGTEFVGNLEHYVKRFDFPNSISLCLPSTNTPLSSKGTASLFLYLYLFALN